MASEWDQRQLCPDGGCVGVIGRDGTCKVCGRAAPGWGDERRRGLQEPDADDDDDDADDDGDDTDDADDAAASPASPAAARAAGAVAGPDDIENRELCPDGACIGVIGDDGRCRVCGRTA